VRKICAHCREAVDVSPEALLEAGLDPAKMRGQAFYEGRGCLECEGSGFHGRIAIAELLDLSDRIRGLILERRPAAEIKKAAKEEGMAFLRDAALEKVFEGTTTLKEINKVTFVE
jgi:type IV pilus assembly protein PilB